VSVHTVWLAAAMLAVLGTVHEGPAAVTRLTTTDMLAGGYLAVMVTAVAFVLWYGSVARLGAGTAGLLTGVAPVAAALTGVALGGPAPQPLVWAGIATVAAGLALGLRPSPAARAAASPPHAAAPPPHAAAPPPRGVPSVAIESGPSIPFADEGRYPRCACSP
jgi:drug/metabolite transporter (DMT)-like permease